MAERILPAKLVVDDGLEGVERLGAGQESAVYEERRCTGHADLAAFPGVLLHVVLELSGSVAGLEGLDVKPEVDRVRI